MNSMVSIYNYLKRTWAGVLFFTLFVWFSFHLMQGERGFFSYKSYQSQRLVKEQEYASLKKSREILENKVEYLRPGSIDPDLLDQQVRYMLNEMGAREYLLPQAH